MFEEGSVNDVADIGCVAQIPIISARLLTKDDDQDFKCVHSTVTSLTAEPVV